MIGSTRNLSAWSVAATVALLLPALAAAGTARGAQGKLLSGPSDAPAREIALAHLRTAAGELGLEPGDVADVAVTDVVPTRHSGMTSVYLRQRVNGLEIEGAEMGIHIDRMGRIFHRTGSFVRDVEARVRDTPSYPRLSPEEAVRAAAAQVGAKAADADLELVEEIGGVEREVVYSGPGLSEKQIPVRLRYYRTPGTDRLTLAWNLNLSLIGSPDWFDVWVDAATGELVGKVNWTSDATYRVFAMPKESPYDGPRTDEVDPYLLGGTDPGTGASPWGWHDLNGAPGAETTLTSGNNVNACVDAVAPSNQCDPGSQPDGGASLIFQPFIDLVTQQPADYMDAAVVNLYYWNNIMHDVTYQYGFDEVSGNFQENNYGRGGAGSDSVNAEAQDLSGVNNANFSTSGDGVNPRMQMYVWTNPFSQFVTVNSPPGIAGSYVANPSNNGGTGMGLTADMAIVVDGTPPTDDACQTVTNDLTGKIALITWSGGLCNSSVFVLNAANAGAIAAVIIDTQDPPLTNFGGSPAIPSVAVGNADGILIRDTITGGMTVNSTLEDNPAGQINRDSDIDAGIIAHEYGHGISNRLTGGPALAGCLNNGEEGGEGWSDWMTLFLHAEPGETRTTSRSVGGYAAFDDPVTGTGIRRFPYNTDNMVNPLTYGDLAANPEVHDIGEVWAVTLWEMYWNLVDVYGYDPDVYGGTGGNNLAFQLVMDGMKLQPCGPGFLDARDAILAADLAGYEGDDKCEIWRAFAERGMGANAIQGSNNAGDETEGFDLPPECTDQIFSNSFGPRWQELWSSSMQ